MTDWIAFEGVVEPLEWGASTYTILRLPADVSEKLEAQGARRVEGEFADHPVNLALSKAPPVDGVFLWTGKSLLDRVGLTPGEPFDVRLRRADVNRVDVPDDVIAALRSAGVTEGWSSRTPGKQRGLLYQIETAKRPETRARRIETLIETLRDDP